MHIVHTRRAAVQAVAASRLEEDSQVEQYGFVEGGHDIDAADLRTRAGGAALFLALDALAGTPAEPVDRRARDIDKAMDALQGLGF